MVLSCFAVSGSVTHQQARPGSSRTEAAINLPDRPTTVPCGSGDGAESSRFVRHHESAPPVKAICPPFLLPSPAESFFSSPLRVISQRILATSSLLIAVRKLVLFVLGQAASRLHRAGCRLPRCCVNLCLAAHCCQTLTSPPCGSLDPTPSRTLAYCPGVFAQHEPKEHA